MTAVTPPAQVDSDNPWPGLSSYDEASREFFSGRKRETEDLQRRILAEPVTVLFGKSGLGKTSLLKAGVFPGLREKGLFPILIRLQLRPGSPPLMEQVRVRMFQELRAQSVEHPAAADSETLWDYLHRSALELWTTQNRLVRPLLVFDQFEELFTLGRAVASDVQRFRDDLADLVENRIPAAVGDRAAGESAMDEQAMPCKVVISLREDFLADLEEWRLSMPSLRRNRMRLLPMGRDQAFQAVFNERTSHLVSEPLAGKIVDFLASGAAAGDDSAMLAAAGDVSAELAATVEPVLLSLFCHGVNEHRKRDKKPAFDDELVEGAKGTVVLDFYRESVGDLPKRVRKFIEEQLITDQGFRNSYPIDSAIAREWIKRAELDRLINLHLLRHEHYLGADRVELTHDLLAKAVVDERKSRRHSERTRRWAMGVAAACLVVMLASGLMVRYFSQQASSQQRALAEAESRVLLARAERELSSDPKRAIALALEALGRTETSAARSVLINSAQYAWPEAILGDAALHGVPTVVSLSSDGTRLAVLAEGAITVWDVSLPTTATPVWPKERVFEDAASVAFSPDLTLLAVGRQASVDLLDPATGSPPERSLQAPTGDYDRRVGFSPDSRWLAASTDAGLVLWDLHEPSDESRAENRIEGQFGGFALLSGDRIVTARDDGVLAAYVVERAQNGGWTDTRMDLSACMNPESVSPGSRKYSATWGARGCTFDATENSDEWPDMRADRPTADIVWSTGGRAFVEFLMPGGFSQDVLVGREYGSYRLENRLKTEDLPSESDKSRLVTVSEDGRRAAFIDYDDEGREFVRILSLADHKPFLSAYTTNWVTLAPDASWIAFVQPDLDDDRAVLRIVALDERFWRGEPSQLQRIELESVPGPISAAHGVVVVTSDDLTTSQMYDIVTGQPRFESLNGEARPLGREGQLLFLPSDRRVIRVRDEVEIERWDETPSEGPIVLESPAGEAIAVLREESASSEMRATLYAARGEALVRVGEIAVPSSGWDLIVADDGQSLIGRQTDDVWRVGGEPSGARASAAGRYEIKSPEEDESVLNIVRIRDSKLVGTFPYDAASTRHSSDGRRLAMWGEGKDYAEIQVFDFEREAVEFHVRIDAPSGAAGTDVRFVASNRVIRVETNGNATLVPLDHALAERFASWLAPPNLDEDQRCLDELGGEECADSAATAGDATAAR